MFFFGLDLFRQPMCGGIVDPYELNHLPTTVDGDSFNSFSTVSSFAP
jgi:hypothetical protein